MWICLHRIIEANVAIAAVAFFVVAFVSIYLTLRCCFGFGSKSKRRSRRERRRVDEDGEGVASTAEEEWAAVGSSSRNQVNTWVFVYNVLKYNGLIE